MGQGTPGGMNRQSGDRKNESEKKEKKFEPAAPPSRVGRKQRKQKGPEAAARLPTVTPLTKCKLRLLKLERIKDYLLMEEEFVANQERLKPQEEKTEEDRSKVDDLRGSPMSVGNLEELIDENHAIVSSSVGPEYYVGILSFVDKDQLEPGCAILMHNKVLSVVGLLQDDVDPMVSVMKVEKAPLESYADIGGLDAQIQEIKEAVELPLTHPELYEDIGIKPPKGVILYGEPGTGKTLLAKAVANSTSATFLRVVGSELIQKYLGDGPKLVRELFRVADDLSPSIVFIDEIDAVGTKRYDAHSGGEREIQRTMLELLNQLDGFDSRGDVKELDDGKILLRVAHLYEVDTVTSIQRKTFGLALSIILTLRLPQVLDKLDQILSVCTSVILGGSEDLTEEESSNDHISSTRPHFPSKEFRKRQIKISDPVNQSSLENSVRENLQTCAALHGESFNSAISRMHPAAFDQLKQALKMT